MQTWATIRQLIRHGYSISRGSRRDPALLEVSGDGGPSQAVVLHVLKALQGLAEANRYDFENSPELLSAYEHALDEGRFRYVPDPDTCGLPDCWSTFKGIYERYPVGPILGDCEDFACAHAAYLTTVGGSGLVGLRPGRRIAHAICAEEPPAAATSGLSVGAPSSIIDPSVDFGMKPLAKYDGIYWMRVRRGPYSIPLQSAPLRFGKLAIIDVGSSGRWWDEDRQAA